MDAYYLKRIVSFLCHHKRSGKSKEECFAAGLERRPPHRVEDMEVAWPHAVVACDNADAWNAAPKTARLRDVCKLPPPLSD